MTSKQYQPIFKNIFEYHTKGMLNDKEFCELMDLIYYYRWGDGIKVSSVSRQVLLVWNALEPTIAKSKEQSERENKGGAPKGNQNARKTHNKNADGNFVGIIGNKDF